MKAIKSVVEKNIIMISKNYYAYFYLRKKKLANLIFFLTKIGLILISY